MAARYFNPREQYLTENGVSVAIRDVFQFFEPGTQTAKPLFTDESEGTPIPSTQETDDRGELPIIFFDGLADIQRTSAAGVDRGITFNVEGIGAAAPFPTWAPTVNFPIPEIVRAADLELYQSLSNTNLNQNPTGGGSLTFWEHIQFLGTWNTNISYGLIALVQDPTDGLLYISRITPNLGNTPSTDSVSWAPAAAGNVPDEVDAAANLFNFANLGGFN